MLQDQVPGGVISASLHPAEWRLIQHLRKLRNGMLELKVSDGLPVVSERAIQKVKYI